MRTNTKTKIKRDLGDMINFHLPDPGNPNIMDNNVTIGVIVSYTLEGYGVFYERGKRCYQTRVFEKHIIGTATFYDREDQLKEKFLVEYLRREIPELHWKLTDNRDDHGEIK